MSRGFKELTSFFRDIDAEAVEHSGKSYLAHVIGVHDDLKSWGCEEAVCLGGMFHSIYGTEIFQSFSLSLDRRDEVRDLIGERAEALAYWNCLMDRDSFDANLEHSGPYSIQLRSGGDPIELSDEQFHDLCTIHLCDWLEQVPRSQQWDYRRAAYEKMAAFLGGMAADSHARIFAQAQS